MARQSDKAERSELFAQLGSAYRVMKQLGYSNLPTDHNPVWLALAGLNPIEPETLAWMVENDELTTEEAEQLKTAAEEGRSLAAKLEVWRGKTADKGAILKAYVLCQTACLNEAGGPLRDGTLVSLRQRWYFSKSPRFMGFKMAAQMLEQYCIKSADVVLVDDERAYRRAQNMGAARVEYKPQFKRAKEAALKAELGRQPRIHRWPKGGWGRTYAQAQSAILADLVRDGLTYENLWMRDSSKYLSKQSPLIKGLHGALLIEKEKLYDAFLPYAKALGFSTFGAMGGNNAFSSVEAVLNEHYRDWEGRLLIDKAHPLHVFVISDWDYYGLVPVQDGAVAQFQRYLGDNVEVHRVGISPDVVRECGRSPFMTGYEIEDPAADSAVRDWYDEFGIWMGEKWAPDSVCKGIEMEALEPREYVPFLSKAIIEAAGGDDAVKEALARLAEPNWDTVANEAANEANKMSRLYLLLEGLQRWAGNESYDRVSNPLRSYVHEQINSGTEFTCPHCGSTLRTVSDTCPHCGRDIGWQRYTIHEMGRKPWSESEDVMDAIAEVIEEKEDAIDLDKMATNAEDKGYLFRPVSNDDATQVAVELFTEEYEDELLARTRHADDPILVWLLEGVFEELEGYGLDWPDYPDDHGPDFTDDPTTILDNHPEVDTD